MTALNKADADMVDAIHTDSWLYGDPFCCGTVDFWPNGGRTLQPGCPTRPYALLDKDGQRRSLIPLMFYEIIIFRIQTYAVIIGVGNFGQTRSFQTILSLQ